MFVPTLFAIGNEKEKIYNHTRLPKGTKKKNKKKQQKAAFCGMT